MSNPSLGSGALDGVRVGLVVAFAALGEAEAEAIRLAWDCAARQAGRWRPAFAAYGLKPLTDQAREVDILVYLGESSRFQHVAGQAAETSPILFVKSTVEELLTHPRGAAPRYRMCTGVHGIARALASVAPLAPSVDWKHVPWPAAVRDLTQLDMAELSYVNTSVGAFRRAVDERGIPWVEELPGGGVPFSIFLTMHDPAAARLAQTALTLWPGCTVLAADGMVSTCAPDGAPWPERLVRVRHWSPAARSECNGLFQQALGDQPIPDFDSAGMLFGALLYLDRALAAGGEPARLEDAGQHPGPLGPMQMSSSGRPAPERIMVFYGGQSSVLTIE